MEVVATTEQQSSENEAGKVGGSLGLTSHFENAHFFANSTALRSGSARCAVGVTAAYSGNRHIVLAPKMSNMAGSNPIEFEGILAITHAVTYEYSAAMADRSFEEGKNIYMCWVTSIWQGEVSRVIEELRLRSQELGEPTAADKLTNPCRVVSRTQKSLENHQPYMNYPRTGN